MIVHEKKKSMMIVNSDMEARKFPRINVYFPRNTREIYGPGSKYTVG